MNRTTLAKLVTWSKGELDRQEYQNVLRSGLIRRARYGFGGSHTVVTYPPLEALQPLDDSEILPKIEPTRDLNVYLHIAFCEHICPFCHYVTTRTPIGKSDSRRSLYVGALLHEIDRWRDRLDGSEMASLYVGGGTPTSLAESDLLALVARFDHFKKRPGYRACIETSPITTTSLDGKKKLQALVGAGIDRISIGIQTFDDRLLQRDRGHNLDTALGALNILLSLGVEINLDLIQDLPGQTDDSIINDVLRIDSLRPDQVTWYILRLQAGSKWYKTLNLADGESIESVRRRLLIRKAMEAIGYWSRPGGRFTRDNVVRDNYKVVRGSNVSKMIGMGASAYSHGWGYFFRNSPSGRGGAGLNNYIEDVQRRGFAIESGLPLGAVEVDAGRLVTGIRSSVRLPESTPETEAYLNRVSKVLRSLCINGLAQVDDEGTYSLTQIGTLFEEEICSLFYSPAIRRRLECSNRESKIEAAEFARSRYSASRDSVFVPLSSTAHL